MDAKDAVDAARTGTVVALVDERGELDHVFQAGVGMVEGTPGSRLILYDGSSASELTEPIASPVSAEGVADQFGALLSPEDLERLGRPEIAGRVREARARGIDAWARLASAHGVDALMEFARSQDADLVLLPEDLAEPGVLDRLRGDTLDEAELVATVPFQVVPRDRPPPD